MYEFFCSTFCNRKLSSVVLFVDWIIASLQLCHLVTLPSNQLVALVLAQTYVGFLSEFRQMM